MKETAKNMPLGHMSYITLEHETLHSFYFYTLSEVKELFWKFDFPYNPNLKIKKNFKKLSEFALKNNIVMFYGFYE